MGSGHGLMKGYPELKETACTSIVLKLKKADLNSCNNVKQQQLTYTHGQDVHLEIVIDGVAILEPLKVEHT